MWKVPAVRSVPHVVIAQWPIRWGNRAVRDCMPGGCGLPVSSGPTPNCVASEKVSDGFRVTPLEYKRTWPHLYQAIASRPGHAAFTAAPRIGSIPLTFPDDARSSTPDLEKSTAHAERQRSTREKTTRQPENQPPCRPTTLKSRLHSPQLSTRSS